MCLQLLDLCTLDITSRQFAPSVLATSAMYLALDGCKQHLKLFTGESRVEERGGGELQGEERGGRAAGVGLDLHVCLMQEWRSLTFGPVSTGSLPCTTV